MKYILLIPAFAFITCCMAQQQMDDALYDQYRERFCDHFVLAENSRGGGIPLSARWLEKNCDDEWLMRRMCEGNGLVPGKKGLLDWSDGTVYMGHYLAVLGTEYKRFAVQEKNVGQTVKEISLVIEGLKRLDIGAEVKYKKQGESNGFLLRDDVDLEAGLKIDPEFGCVKSGKVCRTGIADGNMMSQDQVIHLLFGSAFIIQLVPDTVMNIYSGKPVVTELKDHLDKIIRYFSKRAWIIKDPDGNNVPLGYSAVGYSFGLARAGKSLTGKSYGNATSLFLGRTLWKTLEETPFQPSNNLHNEVNLAMQLCLMAVAGPDDGEIYRDLCMNGKEEMFLLAEAVLHKHLPSAPASVFESLLASVPTKGPCYNSPGCENVPGWEGSNRWLHRTRINGSPHGDGAEFNGLDIMLLYNLYWLSFR